jgi:hypothetical protein
VSDAPTLLFFLLEMEKVRPPLSLLHNTGENSFRTQHLCWEVVSGLVESLPSNALRSRGAQILHECGIRSRFPYQDLLWLYDCRHDHTILLLPRTFRPILKPQQPGRRFRTCRSAAVHQTQKEPRLCVGGRGDCRPAVWGAWWPATLGAPALPLPKEDCIAPQWGAEATD